MVASSAGAPVASFENRARRLAGVQYHPEAAPGPHDALYLFRRFLEEVEAFHGATGLPVEKQRADQHGI